MLIRGGITHSFIWARFLAKNVLYHRPQLTTKSTSDRRHFSRSGVIKKLSMSSPALKRLKQAQNGDNQQKRRWKYLFYNFSPSRTS